MKKDKIKLLVEIGLFVGALCVITFIYYFGGNTDTQVEEEYELTIVKINDDNYVDEVLNSDKPLILEFSSNSCPPCLTMIPTMVSIAKNNEDIKVANVNTSEDNTSSVADMYNVQAYPTIYIIKNGEVIKEFIGATSEEDILKELK